MIRFVLTQLILFLLPFIGYGVWLFLNNRAKSLRHWGRGPLLALSLSGLALTLVGAVFIERIGNVPDGANYVPAQFRDGVVVPGHYE